MAQYMTLPDGRNFEYFISGATDGYPLFWIHGTPGSYVPAAGIPEVCQEKGVRCITMSRAGYGESTRKIERKVVDCVLDIEALRDHLGIKEFIVGGWSGGGKLRTVLHFYIGTQLTILVKAPMPSLVPLAYLGVVVLSWWPDARPTISTQPRV